VNDCSFIVPSGVSVNFTDVVWAVSKVGASCAKDFDAKSKVDEITRESSERP
jgi:hypothetical protein